MYTFQLTELKKFYIKKLSNSYGFKTPLETRNYTSKLSAQNKIKCLCQPIRVELGECELLESSNIKSYSNIVQCILFAPSDKRAIFLNNDSLRNDTCCVYEGA